MTTENLKGSTALEFLRYLVACSEHVQIFDLIAHVPRIERILAMPDPVAPALPEPGPLFPTDIEAFQRLLVIGNAGQLCLMSGTRREGGEPVSLICEAWPTEDEGVMLTPVAELLDSDSIHNYVPPGDAETL